MNWRQIENAEKETVERKKRTMEGDKKSLIL